MPIATPTSRIAVRAQQHGVPVDKFLDAARWLLRKNCPYCKLGTQILRRIHELGEDRANALITRILEAKSRNDLETLKQIKQELNGGN